MSDWYDQIEPEVRELVRLLRNNGFNTTCSCGHDLIIEMDLGNLDETELLGRFVLEHGVEKFWIEARLIGGVGAWARSATLHLLSLPPHSQKEPDHVGH